MQLTAQMEKLCFHSWGQESSGGMFKGLLFKGGGHTWGRCCQSASGPRDSLTSRLWNLDSLHLFHYSPFC